MKKIIFVILILAVIVLTGCSPDGNLNEAEEVAKEIVILWQQELYEGVYSYLTPELKAQRSEADFVAYVSAAQEHNRVDLDYKNISLVNEETANAYYSSYAANEMEPKEMIIEMNLIDGKWKIKGFEDYITGSCVSKDCYTEEKPKLIQGFMDKCLQSKHSYWECEYIVERDYKNIKFTCDKSTGYKCTVIE
jgi:hypothetical protein